MTTHRNALTFGGISLLMMVFVGCGPSGLLVDPHFERVWQRTAPLDAVGQIEVAPDGEHLLLGGRDGSLSLAIVDGQTGAVAWSEGGIFVERRRQHRGGLRGALDRVAARSERSPAGRHEFVLLGDDVLVFHETVFGGAVKTRLAASGEERWTATGYTWNPERWRGVAAAGVRALFDVTGSARAAGLASGVATFATEGSPIADLVRPLPGQDAFVLLAEAGLVAFDQQSGEERWRVDGFGGGRIAELIELDDGSVVVVSGYRESLRGFTSPHHVARVSVEGELMWMEAYRALDRGVVGVLTAATGAEPPTVAAVAGDMVIVGTSAAQVFDLHTGERIFDVDVVYGANELPLVTHDPTGVYVAVDATMEVARGRAFTSGSYTRVFRADLATGEETWSLEPDRTEVYDVHYTDGLLLVAASGPLAGGEFAVVALDPETGDVRWRAAPVPQVGALARRARSSRIDMIRGAQLLVHDGRLFVAGPRTIQVLDLATGEPHYEIAHEDTGVGRIHAILVQGETLAAISTHGIAFYEAASGELAFASENEEVSDYLFAGDRVFLMRENNGRVVDLRQRAVIGTFRADPPSEPLRGSLGGGVAVSEDGRNLFLLDSGGTMARFRLGSPPSN